LDTFEGFATGASTILDRNKEEKNSHLRLRPGSLQIDRMGYQDHRNNNSPQRKNTPFRRLSHKRGLRNRCRAAWAFCCCPAFAGRRAYTPSLCRSTMADISGLTRGKR